MSAEWGVLCTLCGIEIATEGCPHMVEKDGQVILSQQRWEMWSSELVEMRTKEAAHEDRQREVDDLVSVNRAQAYDEAYGKARAHMMGQLADTEFVEEVAKLWYEFNEIGRVWDDAPPEMRLQWVNHTRPRLRILGSLLRSTETLG